MKEYIKKFANASAADNYAIVDILFTSTVEEAIDKMYYGAKVKCTNGILGNITIIKNNTHAI